MLSCFSCIQLSGDPVDCSLLGPFVHGVSSGKNTRGGCHSSPGDLPDPGIEPMSLMSPTLAGRFFTIESPGKPYDPYVLAKSLQSCLTLCDPMDCSLPGSSVHGILQAITPEWVVMSSSRGFPGPGIEHRSLMSPAFAGRFFTTSTTWEARCEGTLN